VPENFCESVVGKEKRQPELPFLTEAAELFCCNLRLGTNCTELLAEFFHATGSVDNFVLAGVKRVRLGRHLDFDERVVFAFEIDCFTRLHGRTRDKFKIAGQIVEHDFAIIRVYASFHIFLRYVWVANRHFAGRFAS
jgi:hypothetical protein